MGGMSRRAPFPYDIRLDGRGYMLLPSESGLLVGRKVESYEQVQPTDYSYANLPPYVERTTAFRRLVAGMGQRVQSGTNDLTYYYGRNVDLSIGGLAMAGPQFVAPLEPALTGRVRGAADFPVSGTLKRFVLAGRYVLVRNGDTAGDWTVSKDLGADRYGTSIVRFKDAAGTDALYVATDNGGLWQFTGASDTTVWAACTLPAGGAALAGYLEVTGDELWFGAGNKVVKCETGPTVDTNWAAWITVGEGSQRITGLRQMHNVLFVLKRDGIYSLNTDGTDNELFPSLRPLAADSNGQNAVAWMGKVWLPWSGSYWSLNAAEGGGAAIEPAAPGRLLENDSPVRGAVTAAAGHNNWFLYYTLQNGTTAYLCKLGTWLNPEGGAADWRFAEACHGALAEWAEKEVSYMDVSNVPGPNPRLWVFFADGTLTWTTLPKDTPNPLADANCRFTTTTGELYLPLHHAMFQADVKAYRGLSVFGPVISPLHYVTASYRLTTGGVWLAMGIAFNRSGQRVEWVPGVAGKQIELRFELHAGANTGTPVVEGAALHQAVRPALALQYEFNVDGGNHVARRDGAAERRDAASIRAAIQAAARETGSVTLLLPGEESKEVCVTDYAEAVLPRSRRHGIEWALPVKCVEWRTNTLFGTYRRLEDYLYGDLEAFTYAQLENL